jgi:hypothetical protein
MIMNTLAVPLAISAKEFAHLGMSDVAYIRPVVVDGTAAFSIHAADGTAMGMLGERAVAEAAIRQLDLEPLSVH